MDLKKDSTKFTSMYRGKVLDNDDPDKLGRIKVNVLGIFDEIDSEYLPWAVPAQPLFTGSGSGYGHFAVPEVGSYVWCFFEQGDHNQPVYFAEALTAVHGLPSERTTNYPSRRVMKTKNGIVVYIDDSNQEVRLNHPSGAYVRIDGSGNIYISGTTINLNP